MGVAYKLEGQVVSQITTDVLSKVTGVVVPMKGLWASEWSGLIM